MKISATQPKCMSTSRILLKCKLERDNKIIQNEMQFMYLGIKISGHGEVETEVRGELVKAAKAIVPYKVVNI